MSLNGDAGTKTWDLAKVAILIDGMALDLPSTGDLFQVQYDADSTTLQVDVWGNGIKIINHNGAATVQLTVSRFSNLYQKVLESTNDSKDYMLRDHSVTILTPVERFTTTDASIERRPAAAASNAEPTASFTFHALHLKAEPNK